MEIRVSAFTIKSEKTANVLTTLVDIYKSGYNSLVSVKAIWDTGATNSCITTKVVKQLKLVPTGQTKVATANGEAIQNTYTIDIGLPNNLQVKGVLANEVSVLTSDNEVLIGMDVINLGDFSITNLEGQTCMSFRTTFTP